MTISVHPDLAQVDAILRRYPHDESSLVMVLQDIQAECGFLPCEALARVAHALALPRSRVFSVATFYRALSLRPQGRTVIQVCKGTACHVRGATLLEQELGRQLGVAAGETTKDLSFTLRTVNCVGACALAPVVLVGDEVHREVKPVRIKGLLRRASRRAVSAPAPSPAPTYPARLASRAELRARSERARQAREKLDGAVRVCGGPGCLAAGARTVLDAIGAAADAAGLRVALALGDCFDQRPDGGATLLSLTGCQGACGLGPLVHVEPGDRLYTQVTPGHAAAVVEAMARASGAAPPAADGPACVTRAAHPFYRGQVPRALGFCGRVDPASLDDYLAEGGFAGLERALFERTAAELVDEIARSGLRGRGGAGFETARKWRTALGAARASGHPPYVLCNGDEGDPGAFMDRALMEGSPFQIVEGMLIGSVALGAREGLIYVRAEYPLAVRQLEHAIGVCRQAGLLGDGILGTRHCFDLRISRGGGAFVCGESTALMRSIEGKVGEPRAKYVRSAERGLYDRPTVLNNVETWALVPGIVLHGPPWIGSLGTARSKGTKVFSLVGQVERTGLVEVPMGMTLRTLIFDVGGGLRDGQRFKAVQTGGPSGGCLPESCLDLPIDFEALDEAGSMMGSGGMIVMGERACMVDVARYFVEFLLEESCGKCAPCRLGLPQLSFLLRRVSAGEATAADLDAIAEVARGMAVGSLCGLGKSAPNPVLSTLRYFRDEYEAHLGGVCPAGVCRALIRYEIGEACTGCTACLKPCPQGAIAGRKDERHVIDARLCDRCGICASLCKPGAIRIASGASS